MSDRWRLFIALWPPAALVQPLAAFAARLHAACGGRKITQQNQHITIAFLGDVESRRVPALNQALGLLAAESFELCLDTIEYRRRGGMLWARASVVPVALDALVRRLQDLLRELGHRVEQRTYVPHVTLLRDAEKPPPDASLRMVWCVNELTLVRSKLGQGGARYEVLHRIPLRPGASR